MRVIRKHTRAFTLVELPVASRRKRAAFTLVELLVVIGIIAALIGILLPVLSGVQQRGRDIKCQSNLRQIVMGLYAYCAENKGSFPWGFIANRVNNTNPDPWNPSNNWRASAQNVNGEYMSWASLIGKNMGNRGSPIDANGIVGAALRTIYPPVFQCPEAAQSRDHVVGYVMNFIVAVSPQYEFYIGDARSNRSAALKPPVQTMLLKDTALVWDTAVLTGPGWEEGPGYLVGADIDRNQRFWDGAGVPQFRYFDQRDPWRAFPGKFGQNEPIHLSWDTSTNRFLNIDPAAPSSDQPLVGRFPYQGNVRFRHAKNTACNVGFADGSVRQFTCKMNADKSVDQTKHDAIRRYFMIKWPAGVPRNPQYTF